MRRITCLALLPFVLAACAEQPVIEPPVLQYEGEMPADFSGSWQRDYLRGDEVDAVLRNSYHELSRRISDPQLPRGAVPQGPSQKDVDSLVALARLAELITRPDVLTIVQDAYEIRVDRKDDFSMQCAFFDGVASGIESPHGTEICGWDGKQLVSNLVLPGGLQVTHRFTISSDSRQLRVVTTLASSTSRVPFTLRRFYTRFERPPPNYNCIETLSMKRVCSTGELNL
jgi:hypothetical protein